MTKTALSSDLNLVKEIEQLRIKQKLLLQAFKDKEKKEDQEELLHSISAQVQFLVEIFKEVNSVDKEAEEENKNNHEILMEKIDSVKTAVFERMDLFEKKIDQVQSKQEESSLEDMLEVNSEDGSLIEDNNKISESEITDVFIEKEKSQQSISKENTASQELKTTELGELPKPDFKVEEEPKKKGWFK